MVGVNVTQSTGSAGRFGAEVFVSLPMSEGWWALGDDLRTLPLGQIVAGIPRMGELSLL
jgi:hypothetical protein